MKTWETREGDEIEYKDLKDSHLLNILKWIRLRAENGITKRVGGGGWSHEDYWYDEFEMKGQEVLDEYDYKGLQKEALKRNLIL